MINIESIEELILHLPDIALYISSGFVFIKVFSFVTLKKKTCEIEHIYISSLIIGYIICQIMLLIPINLGYVIDSIGILSTSAFIAYILAMIYKLPFIEKIFLVLRIPRTLNEDVWTDIMDNKYSMWVRMSSKELKIEYFGMISLIEENQQKPYMVLSRYSVTYLDGLFDDEDYLNDPKRRVVVDLNKFDTIELIYNENSTLIEDVKEIINKEKKSNNNTGKCN